MCRFVSSVYDVLSILWQNVSSLNWLLLGLLAVLLMFSHYELYCGESCQLAIVDVALQKKSQKNNCCSQLLKSWALPNSVVMMVNLAKKAAHASEKTNKYSKSDEQTDRQTEIELAEIQWTLHCVSIWDDFTDLQKIRRQKHRNHVKVNCLRSYWLLFTGEIISLTRWRKIGKG